MEVPQPWSVLKAILKMEEWKERAGKSQKEDASKEVSTGIGNL